MGLGALIAEVGIKQEIVPRFLRFFSLDQIRSDFRPYGRGLQGGTTLVVTPMACFAQFDLDAPCAAW